MYWKRKLIKNGVSILVNIPRDYIKAEGLNGGEKVRLEVLPDGTLRLNVRNEDLKQ